MIIQRIDVSTYRRIDVSPCRPDGNNDIAITRYDGPARKRITGANRRRGVGALTGLTDVSPKKNFKSTTKIVGQKIFLNGKIGSSKYV